MKRVGVTGGIGSGKSVVSFLMQAMGIPVYIADDESKRLTASDLSIRSELTTVFGPEVFKGGILDKAYFASLIFGNEANLKRANAIIHPVVLKDYLSWVQKHSDQPVVAVESAILFESGFDRFVDYKVTVSAPLDIRIQRIVKRDRIAEKDALARISSQLPDEQKCRLSDFVVVNDGYRAILPQVENFLKMVYS